MRWRSGMFRVIDVVQILGGDLVAALELRSSVDVIDDIDDALYSLPRPGEPVVWDRWGSTNLPDPLQFGDRQRHVLQLLGREPHLAEILGQKTANLYRFGNVADELLEGGTLTFEPVEDVNNVRLEVPRLTPRSFSNVLNSSSYSWRWRRSTSPEPGEGRAVASISLVHVHQEPGDGLVGVGGQAPASWRRTG